MSVPTAINRLPARNRAVADLPPPIFVGDLDLDQHLPDLNTGRRFEGARLLVRLHQHPIGEVTVDLDRRPLSAEDLAERVWSLLGDRIAQHCVADGIQSPDGLPVAGL